METVDTDVFSVNNKNSLCILDCHSKILVIIISGFKSNELINTCKIIFLEYGCVIIIQFTKSMDKQRQASNVLNTSKNVMILILICFYTSYRYAWHPLGKGTASCSTVMQQNWKRYTTTPLQASYIVCWIWWSLWHTYKKAANYKISDLHENIPFTGVTVAVNQEEGDLQTHGTIVSCESKDHYGKIFKIWVRKMG